MSEVNCIFWGRQVKYCFNIMMSLVLVALTACSTYQEGKQPTPNIVYNPVPEYFIGVGDKIAIQVWKSPELSITLPVRPDGKISAPLVGDIAVAGKSASMLTTDLTQKFSNYIRNPQVTVLVIDPVSATYLRRVRLTGAVMQPVSLNYHQGITVLDLVLEGGGLSDFANANKTKLYRTVGDKVEIYPIRLKDILDKGLLETNYHLAPSDILTVPERIF